MTKLEEMRIERDQWRKHAEHLSECVEAMLGFLSEESQAKVNALLASQSRNVGQLRHPPGCTCTYPANPRAGHQGMCPLRDRVREDLIQCGLVSDSTTQDVTSGGKDE